MLFEVWASFMFYAGIWLQEVLVLSRILYQNPFIDQIIPFPWQSLCPVPRLLQPAQAAEMVCV